MSRSKTSKRWLKEHFDDEYVKKAQRQGYRSRAVYKLLELQEKEAMIKPGMTVVDLGAAPGGWSQLARELLGNTGQVIALDLLLIDPIPDVTMLQGDFCEQEILDQLMVLLAGKHVDLVLSDMAPNMSGNKAIDMPRSMYLCECAFDFALKVLPSNGTLVMKVFHGDGFEVLLKNVRSHFKRVVLRKPKASRPRSRETYLYATGYKG